MLNDISLLTATFNRHDLTLMMLKSFVRISSSLMPFYILDNSTTTRFPLESSDGITVLDNRNYKNTPDYRQPSKNHCSSLMWAFAQLKTKYVILCDNDVLFKPGINEWIADRYSYDCIGEVGYDIVAPNRLYPYCCIIDLEYVNAHGIQYFDETRCIDANGRMDTGASFYDDMISAGATIKNAPLETVCVHLKGATLHGKNTEQFYKRYADYI